MLLTPLAAAFRALRAGRFGLPGARRAALTYRASAFRSRWPVNQARQGHDLGEQQPLPGLLMVGDAYKPRGHIMAEGVAAGVRRAVGGWRSGR